MAHIRADMESLPDTTSGSVSSATGRQRGLLDKASFKLCVGLSLLIVLIAWFDVRAILTKLLSIDVGFLFLALGIFVLQFFLSCVRWMVILDRQSSAITPRTALSIFGFGTLANLFLVTSLAGISVRAALLLRAGSSVPGALASLTAERIAATAGLGLCGLAGMVFALPELKQLVGEWFDPQTASLILLGMALAALALLLVMGRARRTRNFMKTVWAAFATPGQAIQMIGASAAIVLLGFAGMAMLAQGMALSIDLMFFLAVMPAVALISALPISIGGWGVREGAMVAGLSIYAVPPDAAVALSISYGLGGLLVALLLGASLALLGQSRS